MKTFAYSGKKSARRSDGQRPDPRLARVSQIFRRSGSGDLFFAFASASEAETFFVDVARLLRSASSRKQ